jgi:hypothetical protein
MHIQTLQARIHRRVLRCRRLLLDGSGAQRLAGGRVLRRNEGIAAGSKREGNDDRPALQSGKSDAS